MVYGSRSKVWFVIASLSAGGLLHCGSDDDDSSGGSGRAGRGGGGGAGGLSGGAGRGGGAGRAGFGGAIDGAGTAGTTGGATSGTGGTTGGTSTGGTSGSGAGNAAGEPGEGPGGAGSGGVGGGLDVGGWGGEPGGAAGEGGGGEPGGAGGEGGGAPEPSAVEAILTGTFAPLPDYQAEAISGAALLVRTVEDGTQVSAQILGLDANKAYPIHVHNQPCQYQAGDHYKLAPEAAASASNEIGGTVTANASGVALFRANVSHKARGDALSIVIHDPDAANAKLACADVAVRATVALTASGTFDSLPGAAQQDQNIGGTVTFTRSGTINQSTITYALTGLSNAAHTAYVHTLPCDERSTPGPDGIAGVHYKRDTSNPAQSNANELAITNINRQANGNANATVNLPHRARLDAQSLVIYRNNGALKVACADLTVTNFPDVRATANLVRLPAAATSGYTSLQGSAWLERTLEGTTTVQITASGLTPAQSYPVHIHELPCEVNEGGAHYKLDPSGPATSGNEIWLTATSNANGSLSSQVSAPYVASADARSIVIHDFASGNAKLACANLVP